MQQAAQEPDVRYLIDTEVPTHQAPVPTGLKAALVGVELRSPWGPSGEQE